VQHFTALLTLLQYAKAKEAEKDYEAAAMYYEKVHIGIFVHSAQTKIYVAAAQQIMTSTPTTFEQHLGQGYGQCDSLEPQVPQQPR
jgi:hypothetical protein